MGFRFEKYGPIAGFLITAFIVSLRAKAGFTLPPSMKDLLSAAMNIAAIAAGFLGTVMAILLAIEDKSGIIILKQMKRYKPLLGYIQQALYPTMIFAVISGCGLLIDFTKHVHQWVNYAFAGWAALAIFLILACMRIIRIFSAVLNCPEYAGLHKPQIPDTTP